MLQTLSIRNFALIEAVDLSFTEGLNIITGETGAGKSVLIDGLLAMLGYRVSSDLVRTGTQKAVVEGVFDIEAAPTVRKFLEQRQFDSFGSELIVRREISMRGVSRCFINDTPTAVATVKQLGEHLVDFHGQHDHQSLLKADRHLDFIDSVGGLQSLLDAYSETYRALRQKNNDLSELLQKERQMREQEDFKRFQLHEIEEVSPEPSEFEDLERELAIAENAEFLNETSNRIYAELYDTNGSLCDRVAAAVRTIEELADIDSAFTEYVTELQSAGVILEEVAKAVIRYGSSIEFQPDRLDAIRKRLQALIRLKKKYGSFDEVFRHWRSLKHDLELTENFEREITGMRNSIESLRKELGDRAQKLSDRRKRAAKRIEKSVVAQLKNLGITHAQLIVDFEQTECQNDADEDSDGMRATIDGQYIKAYANGIDRAEFLFSANAGEQTRPLAKTASGGEVSRVMLALKSALAQTDRLPMLVFDEIDTGISGRIAQKVGVAIKNLAQNHQIVSITHLPQIAALANTHVSVAKISARNESYITAKLLSHDERAVEVAKLMSGEEISESSIRSAKELMNAEE